MYTKKKRQKVREMNTKREREWVGRGIDTWRSYIEEKIVRREGNEGGESGKERGEWGKRRHEREKGGRKRKDFREGRVRSYQGVWKGKEMVWTGLPAARYNWVRLVSGVTGS